jgi:hypothetical protein
MGHYMTVQQLKLLAVSALLTFWLAASNHCRLEMIPGLGFLACCEGEGLPAQDKDCETDGCAAVEDSFYKSGDSQPSLSALVIALAVWLLPSTEEGAQPGPDRSSFSALAPPELPVTWQFTFRAAAPPRAPSFVS